MSSVNSIRKFAISLAMFAVVALGSAAVANADQVIINVPNPGLSGTPGPYATVTYTLNGSNIDVTVQMNLGFLAFGEGNGNNGIFGFNVVGSQANDIIVGNDLSNFIFGGAGRDILIGGAGGDVLFGEAGDDILIGDSTVYDLNPAARARA